MLLTNINYHDYYYYYNPRSSGQMRSTTLCWACPLVEHLSACTRTWSGLTRPARYIRGTRTWPVLIHPDLIELKITFNFRSLSNMWKRSTWTSTWGYPGTIQRATTGTEGIPRDHPESYHRYSGDTQGPCNQWATTGTVGIPRDYKRQGWASVLFKRTFQALRSFPFFIKERSNLCVLFRFL